MKRITCEECGGRIMKKEVEFKIYEESIGFFPAEVCTKCGEEIFDEKTSDMIDESAKKKGLWGLDAHATVTQVGTSLALVINKKIAGFLNLKRGEQVYIHPESKRKIVIEVQN